MTSEPLKEKMRKIVQEVRRSGLLSYSEEPFFARGGCDYCKSGGADVYECKGFKSLEDAQSKDGSFYEFNLCADCLQAIHYETEEAFINRLRGNEPFRLPLLAQDKR